MSGIDELEKILGINLSDVAQPEPPRKDMSIQELIANFNKNSALVNNFSQKVNMVKK